MFRRSLLLLTMALAAMALAVTPALAGEEPDPTPPPAAQPAPTPIPSPTPTPTAPVALTGSAHLHTSQGCMDANRAKASVTGSQIESVAFFVDGEKVKTVTTPNAGAGFRLSMGCAPLSFGTHRARAAVTFNAGVSPRHRTLVFQITRVQQVRPQFTG